MARIVATLLALSDSDDSDDLPSFADRVNNLINKEVKEVNRVVSPKQAQIHCISDSDDSRDTVPFSRERSTSPIFSLPDFPKANSDSKNDNANLDDNNADLNYRSVSPVFKVNIQEWKLNQKNGDISSDDDLPFLGRKYVSQSCSQPDVQEYKSMKNNSISSSDDNDSPKKKIKSHEGKRGIKEAEKEMRKKMRLEKQKEKELMKALKASEREILKNQKPEECLKNMKIVLDHSILYLEGSQSTLNSLDQNNTKYSIEENNCKYSVNWYRKVVNISTEDHEILREEREELTDMLVMIIPNSDFLKMIHAYTQKTKGRSSDNSSLAEYVVNIKSLYPDCDITCAIIGFQKYLKDIKDSNFDLKSIAKQIHKNATEEAIIELQLQSSVNFRFLDNMSEFGNLLHHFTKAVAEAPQRKEKQLQKSQAFSWYADIDSHCPIKLSKDRSSFIKLWKQQVQQFQNVGPEVAEAIVSRYPSPRLLLKAYKSCKTTKDAENLLQDIVVRRNYGPLGTQKRIGPELSFKLHLFFTSRDGNKLLKR